MNAILSLLGWLILAGLGVWALWWCWRAFTSLQSPAPNAAATEPAVAKAMVSQLPQPSQLNVEPEPKDVDFRARGERGMGGPIYGDVLCADGVYLPEVWENDFSLSFDGRWICTGTYNGAIPRLIDRKIKKQWLLTAQEMSQLSAIHWQLPRWHGEKADPQSSQDEGAAPLTDAEFEEWLKTHVAQAGYALAPVLDLWMPVDSVPESAHSKPPALPEPPREAAVVLSLQRFLPRSLRSLPDPMQPLHNPLWQLYFNEAPQPWGIGNEAELVWREDGKALALLGKPVSDAHATEYKLAAWSAQGDWQFWEQSMPEDRKPWTLFNDWVEPVEGKPKVSVLKWHMDALLQRMVVDTPELERLHDGRSVSCVASALDACVGHKADGQIIVKEIPQTRFFWKRNLLQPAQWQALSMPVSGKPLQWTLTKEAPDVHGATAHYDLHWGEQKFSGSWELEHIILLKRWALLVPAGSVPRHGGVRHLEVWDGQQMQRINLPGAFVRMRPLPAPQNPRAACAQVLLLMGCVADSTVDVESGTWRWPVQEPSPGPLGQMENSPVYEWRDIGRDEHGFWQLLPRWRQVTRPQHPCADGDYAWLDAPGGDELWWWGGVHTQVNNYWSPELPRKGGISVIRAGAALCDVGPSALPHPEGKGWAMLAWEKEGEGHMQHWLLHWLDMEAKTVRTQSLYAQMPLLKGWSQQQLHWCDGTASGPGPVQTVQWDSAESERLQEGPQGMWMRKKDMRYAEMILAKKDWPWQR